jgi:WD40 repeat protein
LALAIAAFSSCGPAKPPVKSSEDELERCPAASATARGAPPRLLVQDGHGTPVNILALSGDGRLLASAGMDGTLRLWDTASGLLLDRVAAPGAIYGVAFDREGKVLAYPIADAAKGDPHAIEIVDLTTGHRKRIDGFGPFALTGDGARIAIAKKELEIYDAVSGTRQKSVPLALAPEHTASAIAFDAAGARVAVAMPGAVLEVSASGNPPPKRTAVGEASDVMSWIAEIAYTDRGLLMKRVNALELLDGDGKIHKVVDGVGQIAFSGDRLWSATSEEKDYSQGMPDEDAGHRLRALGFDGREKLSVALEREPFRITAAAGGGMVAVTYFDAIRGAALQLIDPDTGRTLRTIEGRPSGVDALAMSRDGSQLAVGSLAALSFWRMPSAEMWFTTRERRLRATTALAFDHQGKQIAAEEAGWLRVRSAASGRLLRAWKHPIGQPAMLAFRAGTSELWTADDLSGEIFRWDLSKLPPESSLDADNLIRPLEQPPGGKVLKMTFDVGGGTLDPQGKHALVWSREGRIALVDLANATPVWTIESLTSFGFNVGFSADGTRVLLSGHRHQPTPTHAGEPIFRAFDVRDGRQLAEVETPTAGPFAARADVIAIAGSHPALLDAKTLSLRARLELPDTRFTSVLADPVRPAFLFGGAAGSTAVVDTRGRMHAVLVATPGGDWIATTPDGFYRASLDGARRIAWSYKNPLEAFSFEQFAERFEQPRILEQRIARMDHAPEPPPRERPPRIGALTIAGGSSTAGDAIKLTAQVNDERQVSHVRAYVNGRLAAQQRVCAPEAKIDLQVPVEPGPNRVSLVAHGPDGLASHPRIADVRSSARAERPTLWVIAVGVSRYAKLAPEYQLEFADDDARSIADALSRLAGKGKPFAQAKVRTLVDRQVNVEVLEEALSSLEGMAPRDLAVVFLAGHGVRLADGKMRFLTSNATLTRAGAASAGVGWTSIQQALDRARGRVLLLLDACHSGHVITDVVAPNESLAKALATRGRAGALVFAASRGSELSYEVGGKSSSSRALKLETEGEPKAAGRGLASGHGLFTSALLDALAGRAPDRDRSGALELDELIGHVSERVRMASGGRQNPWVARRELFGDFALVPAAH